MNAELSPSAAILHELEQLGRAPATDINHLQHTRAFLRFVEACQLSTLILDQDNQCISFLSIREACLCGILDRICLRDRDCNAQLCSLTEGMAL